MSFAGEYLAVTPNFWFRLDETDAQATNPGYKDYGRLNYIQKGGTTAQVATLIATETARATKLGSTGLTPSQPQSFSNAMVSGIGTPGGGTSGGGGTTGGNGSASYGYLAATTNGATPDWNYQTGDSLTLEAWVQPLTTTSSMGTILQITSAVCLIQDGQDLVSVLLFDADSPANYVTQRTVGVFTNTTDIHQIAVVWDNAAQVRKHYVDGALVGTWTETGRNLFAKPVTINGTLCIGQKVGGLNPWLGVIDEPAMWRTALSGSRIAAHWNAGTVVTPSDQTFTIAQVAPPAPVLSLAVSDLTVAQDAPGGDSISVARAFTNTDGMTEQGAGDDDTGLYVVVSVGETGSPGYDGIQVVDDQGNTIAGAMGERGAGRDGVQVIVSYDTTPPPPIENLFGARAGGAVGGRITLSWTHPAGSDAARAVIVLPGRAQQLAPVPATTAAITGLTNGQIYSPVVYAEDMDGNRSAGRSVSVLVGSTASGTPAPTGVTATAAVQSVLVSWQEASGSGAALITKAEVWQEASGTSRLVRTLPVSQLSLLVTNLFPGTAYTFRVRWLDRFGNPSAFSDLASATPLPGGVYTYMTPAQLAALTDHISVLYLIIKGGIGSGYGYGANTALLSDDWGMSKALRTMTSEILDDGDENVINEVYPVVRMLRSGWGAVPYATRARSELQSVLSSLSSLAVALNLTGAGDFDSLSTYFNIGSGGTWQALHAPAFGEAWKVVTNRDLSATNLYGPPGRVLATITAGSAFQAGTPIDALLHAGAGRADATIAGFAGTGGTITVTGTARQADGTTATGRTLTGTIAGNGTITLTPTVSGDLLLSVSGISLPGGMSGGMVSITAQPPIGRTAPAVV